MTTEIERMCSAGDAPSGDAFLRTIRRGRGMAVVLVAVSLVSACGQAESNEAVGPSLVEAGRQNLEIIVEAAGELEPLRTVEVMSKASGEVVEVLVESGDQVTAGQLVARIDPRDVQNDFNQAEADYGVALERLNIAEAQLQRSEQLLQSGVITEQEHEGRDLEFANAQAALVRAETSLELARLRMEDVTIGSPLNGTILTKNVEEGQVISSPSGNVSGGTVLATIADLNVMQVRTLVSEADVGRIEAGMEATVYVDAYQDESFFGTVQKVEPQAVIEQSVVNFPVIVTLDNSDGRLKPGMSANVSVLLAERPNAITLPNNAIVSFDELVAAASVLQVPEDRLQMDPSVFQELRRELRGDAVSGEEVAGGATEGPAPGGPNAERLREQIQGGDLPQEEIQERIAAARASGGGFGPGGAGRPGGFGGAGNGEVPARARSATNSAADGREGIVFVQSEDGALAPRAVLVGVTDWSNSEILAGLEEGETVALIGVAALIEETGSGGGFRRGIPFF